MFFWNKVHVLPLLWVALTATSPAQTFTKLLDFNGGNGASPYYMSLLQGTSGSLYGTDTTGGASGAYGTVFKITVGGSLTTLHSFSNSSDGASPAATLLQASDGNFYGADGAGPDGGGTVFKITPAGTLTTLHSFLCNQSSCPEGGGLVVTNCGRICLGNKKINFSTVFAGQAVGIKEQHDDIWLVTFMDYDLGYFDLETRVLEPLDNPFGPRLSPM